ncbi:MAG: cupin domain-containing protein [Pseudomonadota bacterium]
MNQTHALIACLVLLAPFVAAETLQQTTRSWDGGDLAYPEGDVEITAVRLTLSDGEWLPFHCHPVPTLGYILSGSVRVQTRSGQEAVFSAGDSVVEVMRTIHRGQGFGGGAEIVVFYAGARGLPVTIVEGAEGFDRHCKE